MCNIIEVPIGFSDLLPKDLSQLASPQATPATVHPHQWGSIAHFFLLGIFWLCLSCYQGPFMPSPKGIWCQSSPMMVPWTLSLGLLVSVVTSWWSMWFLQFWQCRCCPSHHCLKSNSPSNAATASMLAMASNSASPALTADHQGQSAPLVMRKLEDLAGMPFDEFFKVFELCWGCCCIITSQL